MLNWGKSLKSYKSALEIKDAFRKSQIKQTKIELRKGVKIAIIDDEKFQARSNLETYGYNVDELQDISSLDKIVPYDIVLCDLMGVGQHFDASAGGASVIKEIKDNYPTKFVVAYTGARANSPEANAAKQYADLYLRKDAEISTWVRELDDAIEVTMNPYERWVITRQGLIDLEVDLREILKLEDAYVTSVINKESNLDVFSSAVSASEMSGHAKSIAQSIVASAIYSMLGG